MARGRGGAGGKEHTEDAGEPHHGEPSVPVFSRPREAPLPADARLVVALVSVLTFVLLKLLLPLPSARAHVPHTPHFLLCLPPTPPQTAAGGSERRQHTGTWRIGI